MADTTSKVIRLTEYDLLRTSITPGRWYMTTDTRKCYKDTAEKQRKFVNVVQIPTEKQRMYETYSKTYGKLYYCWESSNLYVWNGKWELVVGNPEYPNSFQYIDGEIYSVGNYSNDVEGNGILGDGSVVIRDTNRIIKAQIYIDETNDNLVISSFLGGGIKILPNGNMEKTGALHLNPTTIGEDKDGLGTHYNEFENMNGEMYVGYEPEFYESDPNPYQNTSHRYMVWHQGNLDARGLIEGWFLLKDIDETEDGGGKTHIENTTESKGLYLKSENPKLNADVVFATHHENTDGSSILGELTGSDKTDPLNNNAGLYIVKTPEGKIEIHLRKDKERPTTDESLKEDDQLLTKGEIVDLMNEKIYTAVQFSVIDDNEYYRIEDETLVPLIKEGLVISITFNRDTEKENLFLAIGTGPNEFIDLNMDILVKDRPICFKMGSIYQLIRTGNKWLFINPQMKATTQDNGYGLVRVTGDSSDVSSFNIITQDIVDLNTAQFAYDGRYSFVGDINEAFNFPEEEMQNAPDKEMQYVLDVRTAIGRGNSSSMNENFLEQELTNINTGKKYLRYLNRSWYYRTTYEQGDCDSKTGRNKTGNLKVRTTGRLKVTPGLIYSFRHMGLTNIIQASVVKISKTGTASSMPYQNVSAAGFTILMDPDTEYIRMVYQYQDGVTQLNPLLVQGAQLLVTATGYSEWVKIYDEDELTDREKISYETIELPANKWTLNGNVYEQTFYNWDITENTLVEGNLDVINQGRLEVSHIESFNYGFKVVAVALPTENIEMTVIYTETKEV